jgi:ankyrin repeat protein
VAIMCGADAKPHLTYLLALKHGADAGEQAGARVVDLAYVNDKSGNTLLHDVAWNGNAEACEMLLASKAFGNDEGLVSLEAHNKQGQTAMQCAPAPAHAKRPRAAS